MNKKSYKQAARITLFFCFLLPAAYAANSAPAVGTITPSSGTVNVNQSITFTTTYSDSNGYQDISYAYFLINASLNSSAGFQGVYDRAANKVYLCNDSGNGWIGGFTPGTANVIENSYCKLTCANITANGSGKVLTIKWAALFKPGFTGSKKDYLYVKDKAGAYAGWTQKGSINIQQAGDTTPPTGSIKINNDAAYSNTTSVILNLSAQDSGSGMGTGAQMQFSHNNSTWTTAESYVGSKSWALNSGDGTKTVYAKFKDAAGNWSVVYSDSIILDTVKPAITISSPQNGAVVN